MDVPQHSSVVQCCSQTASLLQFFFPLASFSRRIFVLAYGPSPMCPAATGLETANTGLRRSLTARENAAYNSWKVHCAMERGIPSQRCGGYEISQNLGRRQALVAIERLNAIATFAESRLKGRRWSYKDAIVLISEFDAWYSRHTEACPKRLLRCLPGRTAMSAVSIRTLRTHCPCQQFP